MSSYAKNNIQFTGQVNYSKFHAVACVQVVSFAAASRDATHGVDNPHILQGTVALSFLDPFYKTTKKLFKKYLCCRFNIIFTMYLVQSTFKKLIRHLQKNFKKFYCK